MPQEKDKVNLEDVLSYTPESEFTTDDLAVIRSHFNGAQGQKLVRILRKVFLPTISDLELPVEKMMADVLMVGIDFKAMDDKQIKSIVMGRQEAIKIVLGGFIQLRNIANVSNESPEEKTARLAKNSSK